MDVAHDVADERASEEAERDHRPPVQLSRRNPKRATKGLPKAPEVTEISFAGSSAEHGAAMHHLLCGRGLVTPNWK